MELVEVSIMLVTSERFRLSFLSCEWVARDTELVVESTWYNLVYILVSEMLEPPRRVKFYVQ